MRGVREDRREMGASAHVPGVRHHAMLRQLAEQARQQARAQQWSPGRRIRRTRRAVAVLLSRRVVRRVLSGHARPRSGRDLNPRPVLAVDLRNLTKRFGPVTAVNDLSLQIDSGEIVAFLGPNGAGKTTTIDMLLGLSRPDAGSVLVYGSTPDDAIARGEVSAVMQNGGLLKDFTVAETVAYTASLYAHARPVTEVLERAGIGGIADRRVAKCSGGEQQRLRFAMALLSDPRLLILDEPTTGMDVEGRREFWGAIREDA